MRFSRRTPPHFTENRIAGAIRARKRPYLDLTESNPTQVGLSPSEEEIQGALAQAGLARYRPDPRGLLSAREAVAGYYAGRGFAADPDRVILTSSTSEAYAFLFKLLCDPGEAVLVPEPSYPLFDHLTDLEGVRRFPYRLLPEGHWGIELSSVEAGLASGARAVLLVNPNNPTGTFLQRHELSAISRLACASGAALISDEVFLDYPFVAGAEPFVAGAEPFVADAEPFGADATPFAADVEPSGGERVSVAASAALEAGIFSLGGLSKSCALPQLKLAWILAGGPRKEVEEALRRLELISDTYLSVPTPVQIALPALLDLGARAAAAIRARIRRNLGMLDASLAAMPAEAGIARLPAQGGWYAVLRLPSTRSEEDTVLRLLDERDVLVQPGWFFNFPFETILVVSLLPEPGVFADAVGRIMPLLAADGNRVGR